MGRGTAHATKEEGYRRYCNDFNYGSHHVVSFLWACKQGGLLRSQ
jgi:hypothetical protein